MVRGRGYGTPAIRAAHRGYGTPTISRGQGTAPRWVTSGNYGSARQHLIDQCGNELGVERLVRHESPEHDGPDERVGEEFRISVGGELAVRDGVA